ncbi:MAG TPA: hypothetical protein PLX06_05880 [Fimbriimonadaceae bacterium]|nr:hypothetical protein [Fimbriimonadaceae bacterium]
MKKLLSLCAAGVLMAGLITVVSAQGAGAKGQKGAQSGQGQGRGPGGGGGQRRMGGGRMMQEMLSKVKPPVTDAQKKKIEALNTKMRAEFEKLREAPGDMQSKRPKFEALMKKRNDEMNKILNKQQQESLKKLMEEAMKNFQGGRRGGPGGPPPGRGPNAGGAAKPPKGGTKPPL